jgi:hypothetical protein
MRNEIVTSKIFQRERVILCSYLTTWTRKRFDWENVDEIKKEFVKAHEKNQFFLKNIANSFRRLTDQKSVKMFDLSLNFEKNEE